MAQHDARQPSVDDDRLQPGQQHDGPDADAGKGDADGKTAPAHEPVRQELRVRGVGHHVGAAADQEAKRRVEVPWLLDGRGKEQASRHQQHAGQDHEARPAGIHDAADDRAQDRRDQEAEREGSGGKAAIPAELVDQRRHQQRERGPRGHADRHRHERDADDQPAVIERQARRPVMETNLHGTFSGDRIDREETTSVGSRYRSTQPTARPPRRYRRPPAPRERRGRRG